MNRHYQYTRSNINWLEKIPSHWTEVPLKVVASCNDEVLPESTEPDKQINYVEISDVNSILGIKNVTPMPFSESPSRARRIVRTGDILISTVRTYLKAIAAVQKNSESLVASTGFAVIRTSSNNAISKYLGKLVLTDGFIGEIISRSVGVSYPAINASEIMQIKIPLPQLEEQQKIAQFLDYETAKIDALIDEQKRLIELLKEKRQAVISHAVTKGLNPDAPMKDSDVEWLGEVPEHWQVVPLKHKCAFKGGGTPSKENLEFWNGDIPWVSPKDMKSFEISSSIDKITESGLRNSSTSLVPPGSMLLVARSGILQRTIPVAINSVAVSLNQDLKALTFNNQHHAYFCAFLFMGLEKLLLLELRKQGATVESLEQEYLENCSIAWPPLEELKSICRFIENQLNSIRNLTNQSTMLMTTLQERRSALISAAVTGKIDVRDWQPPAGSDTVDSNALVQTERHYG